MSSQPHGTIPSMVRKSVATITGSLNDTVYTLPFMEALFALLGFLVSAPVGVAAFNQSGLIASLIPIIRHQNPNIEHVKVLLMLFLLSNNYLRILDCN